MNDRSGTVDVRADLDLLFEQVRALRELARDPGLGPGDGAVYDFSIRWGTMISGRLPRIVHYRDRLSATDRERFEILRAELADAAPLIDRFRLAPVDLVQSSRSGHN